MARAESGVTLNGEGGGVCRFPILSYGSVIDPDPTAQTRYQTGSQEAVQRKGPSEQSNKTAEMHENRLQSGPEMRGCRYRCPLKVVLSAASRYSR